MTAPPFTGVARAIERDPLGLAGHPAATTFVQHQQAPHLDELTEIVLRRSKFAVELAAASLDELASRKLVACGGASPQAIRLHVYHRSEVKDVRLVNADGSVICSAYSETLEFGKGWVERSEMQASRDAKILLFRVGQFGGDALGVLRDVDDKNALVALLGVNASLFDTMPSELRAHSEVVLALNNGEKLGEFMLDANKPPRQPIDFTKSSARYPLRTTIRDEGAIQSTWTARLYPPMNFIPLAEYSGRIQGMTWQIRERALGDR